MSAVCTDGRHRNLEMRAGCVRSGTACNFSRNGIHSKNHSGICTAAPSGAEWRVSMNFIFISPMFPSNYQNFCKALKANGANVLGIGDVAYDTLTWELKQALTEYYRVDSMENYDSMLRAVAYFTFRYGKIDWIESNNEYWLDTDARLRTDFNVSTGTHIDQMLRWQSKSEMKKYYQAAGIPAAPCTPAEDYDQSLAFIQKYGWPVIVKPDHGVGANKTWRLNSRKEFDYFWATHPKNISFIIEPYVDGTICSYDAIINSRGEPLFESGNVTPVDIMDAVVRHKNVYYYIVKDLATDIRSAGRRLVRSFGVQSRFIHCEFFRLNRDIPWLGPKGSIAGLEANLRPSGGYTTDMLNFANSTDVYRIWAEMICADRRITPESRQHYYCVYIGRRDGIAFTHSNSEVLSRYRASITMSDRMPDVLAVGMGNQMYIAKFAEKTEMDTFVRYVLEED